MATKIEGADKLKRQMRIFPKAAREEIEKALTASAEELVKQARTIVPAEDGDLRDSIGWTFGEPPKGSLVLARAGGTPDWVGANLRITVYAGNERAFYARWVEHGTRPHTNGGLFAGTQHPGTRATGFFFGSYRALRRRIRGRISRAINKAAKRAAAGV